MRTSDAEERMLPTELLPQADATDPPGTLGDEQSDDPVALAEWLAAFDALPAMIASREDEAAFRAARAEQQTLDTARVARLAAGFDGTAQ
jgi:hypothetical protein